MTPRPFKYTQFRKETLDFSLECIQLLQNDFFKQRYITFNATISGQDRIYPNTHLCRTFFAGYISKYLHWLIDNCYQVTIIFISRYEEIIPFNLMRVYCKMHSYCDFFAPKLKVVILVLGYGHFLRDSDILDSTAGSSKQCRLTYVYSHFNWIFYSIA